MNFVHLRLFQQNGHMSSKGGCTLGYRVTETPDISKLLVNYNISICYNKDVYVKKEGIKSVTEMFNNSNNKLEFIIDLNNIKYNSPSIRATVISLVVPKIYQKHNQQFLTTNREDYLNTLSIKKKDLDISSCVSNSKKLKTKWLEIYKG